MTEDERQEAIGDLERCVVARDPARFVLAAMTLKYHWKAIHEALITAAIDPVKDPQ